MSSIGLTTLPSGLRIVTDAMPDADTVTICVWVDVGARHEKASQNGLSHFLEHMAFKGTERRSARQIATEVEAVGGYLNAYTSREQTVYYVRVLKEDMALGLDVLADIVQHSTFDPKELERERGVILQEIGQAIDTPDDIVFDYFQEAAFPGQALGRPILGNAERIGAFQRNDLAHYMAAHYHAGNIVVTAAGAVGHESFVGRVADLFRALAPGKAHVPEAAKYQGGDFREDRDLEQLHLCLGFPGVTYGDPSYPAAQALATVLGGGMSSRLFQEAREVRGLAYSIYAWSHSFTDTGIIGVYAGTSPDQIGELAPVIAAEIGKLQTELTDEEVERAKAQMRAGLLMGLEGTVARAEHLGRQMLTYGRIMPVAEMLAEINAVTPAAVSAMAKRMTTAAPPTVTLLGPLDHAADYAVMRGYFS